MSYERGAFLRTWIQARQWSQSQSSPRSSACEQTTLTRIEGSPISQPLRCSLWVDLRTACLYSVPAPGTIPFVQAYSLSHSRKSHQNSCKTAGQIGREH